MRSLLLALCALALCGCGAEQEPAPGFTPMRIARGDAGILCPDGTFLPPLNGVRASDPIPPIQREPGMPPIGPIVGTFTDDTGAEWWITADGSAFTTRWQEIVLEDGRRARVVRLDQSDSGANTAVRPPDGAR